MLKRILPVACTALALALLTAGAGVNAGDKDKKDEKGKSHHGTVVSVKGNVLTMETKGKEHKHDVPKSAKVTCDGKECKLADLKAGQHVHVTMADDTVTAVEAFKEKKSNSKDKSSDK